MRYHNITKDDMLNGDGLRVVLWVSGCEHHCPECQNPITWNPKCGLIFNKAALREIEEQLEKDYISGITFSGGDPMMPCNRGKILSLCKYIKKNYPDKTIWLYTGYYYEELDKKYIKYVDVLVDGRYIKEMRDTNAKWRGSINQRVIDVQKTLKNKKVSLFCD